MDRVVDSIEAVTPAWLTEMLGIVVAEVTAEPVGTGQIGRSYRLTIGYQDPAADAPPSLVVKFAGGDEAARRRVSMAFRNETGFYAQLAATVDVLTPRCVHCALSDDALGFTLLLEDLTPARPGVQLDGCSPEQAKGAVRNLARLHAPRWNDPALLELDFLAPTTAARAEYLAGLVTQATTEFAGRFADELHALDLATLHSVDERVGAWLLARPAPFSLVHGDYRLDNLMFPPAGDPIALDWQTVTVGPPARDLGYFLGTALPVPDRRAAERALVEEYRAGLAARGVRDYSLDDCFDDYRLGLFQGPFIAVLGSMTATTDRSRDADAMFLSLVTRSCAAIRDLDALDLL